MSAARSPLPPRIVTEPGFTLHARDDAFDELHRILSRDGRNIETLYAWAKRTTRRPPFMGRGPAYAAALPNSGLEVVVRHNRHGGLLAPITSDRFLPPTKALRELLTCERLTVSAVATVEVVGYAEYPAGPFRRADVVTIEIPDSRDLSVILTSPHEQDREPAWRATARLMADLTRAGARHHDLNIKNILLRSTGRDMEALVLDVDRVEFGAPNDPAVTAQNFARLARSARKWRRLHGVRIADRELAALHEMVTRLVATAGATSG